MADEWTTVVDDRTVRIFVSQCRACPFDRGDAVCRHPQPAEYAMYGSTVPADCPLRKDPTVVRACDPGAELELGPPPTND